MDKVICPSCNTEAEGQNNNPLILDEDWPGIVGHLWLCLECGKEWKDFYPQVCIRCGSDLIA